MEPSTIYQEVLEIVNKFLGATIDLTIEELDHLDPTVEYVAGQLNILASLLNGIASGSHEDENMAINSLQCCIVMEQIARAVSATDEHEVTRLVKQLKVHAIVPIPLE